MARNLVGEQALYASPVQRANRAAMASAGTGPNLHRCAPRALGWYKDVTRKRHFGQGDGNLSLSVTDGWFRAGYMSALNVDRASRISDAWLDCYCEMHEYTVRV